MLDFILCHSINCVFQLSDNKCLLPDEKKHEMIDLASKI